VKKEIIKRVGPDKSGYWEIKIHSLPDSDV